MTTTLAHYVKQNVFCRCGQAVTRLAEAGLITRPEMPSSEVEIHEWWLVSAELGERLSAARLPVAQFGELRMWGRTGAAGELVDDLDLARAVGPLPSRLDTSRRSKRNKRSDRPRA